MNDGARKFTQRAPRYTLQPADNRFLRYAHTDERGRSYTTRFIDISTTGLSFVTDRLHSPDVSEVIKVEVPLGDGSTIAWFARVVRVEEYANHKWYMNKNDFSDEHQILVAIRFHDLPASHAHKIRETLNKKFDELYLHEKKARLQRWGTTFLTRFWTFFLYASCVGLSVWFLWSISRPSDNYNGKVGAPWGQRYPWLNFFTPPDEKAKFEDLKIKLQEEQKSAPESN